MSGAETIDCDLDDIKARYERMIAMVDRDASAGTSACALSYAMDVPVLIAEVERLRFYRKAITDAIVDGRLKGTGPDA